MQPVVYDITGDNKSILTLLLHELCIQLKNLNNFSNIESY